LFARALLELHPGTPLKDFRALARWAVAHKWDFLAPPLHLFSSQKIEGQGKCRQNLITFRGTP